MLNKIRELNFSYIILLISLVSVLSGLKMQSGKVEKTFLCFDAGCVHVQGVSNVLLGVFLLMMGVVMIVKERLPISKNRWWPLPKRTSKSEQIVKSIRRLFIIDECEGLTHEER
jgi:hypothetical protein